ncbi:phage tail spike protein [Oceanobacillus profundus]|uniref:Peptidase S74 domain-containing protein n=1 Tax=Oceanobacillus profundus TaxID=372463 RepID=A0A417YJM1_9BACI|nr:phage tail spike protein [Oceanobacillus profundus]RHW33514.1 hypothetical protein D1B32_05575 [Oceanobacillus profundus]
MTELYIFSQNDEPLTIITGDTGLVDTHYRLEVNSVPDTPFSFTVEADSENAKYVKDENKVVYRDHEGDLRLAVIKELDDSDSIDGPLTTAICEPEFMELAEAFVLDRRFTDRTAQFALDAALENTGWIGEVEIDSGLASTNFYRLRVVDAIIDIIKTWGGEFKDVVEFDEENNIVARKVKLLQRLGADTGQRLEVDRNITEIGRTVLSYPKTAMYGYGVSLETEGGGHTRYIDFADVVWSKANGDPVDKPKGQMWVGDPEAFDKYKRFRAGAWRHRYGEFRNQDYEDPEELLWATWNNLQENKHPEVNYRLSLDLFDDKVSLGDTAIAIDRYFSRPIEIQARVIAMEYDLLDIEGTMVVEMGQFLNLDDDRLDEVINEVEKIRNRPSKVTEDSFPNRKPSRPVNVEAHGGFEVIQLYWDYADELFIKHYEVYGSQVADFVPDSQHLLWRGQVSAFAHAVNTDETWYYYVRAVNYHGTSSDWSARVSASTTRIISDDILFGSIIADHLADNLDIADKLAQNTIDRINAGPMEAINYTQEEIEATETRILADLDNRIGDVNANISDLINRADSIDGTITTINQEVDDLEGRLNITINQLTNIDGVVSDHTLTLNALPGQLNAKAEKTEVYTKNEVDTAIDNINIADRNLVLNSDEFISNASYQIAEYSLSERMVEGVTYSISLKGNLPSAQDRWGIYLMSGAGTNLLINLSRDTENNGVYRGTFVGKEYNSSDSLRVYNMPQSTITETASIEWIKLVKGNKPSLDWTPAPEDTFELINDKVDLTVYNNKVSELVVSIDGISGRVKNTETSIDRITGDVDSALSQIGQLDVKADGIIADVSEISSDLGGTQSKLAQLEIKADEIVTTVNNIQIGGRNIVSNDSLSMSLATQNGYVYRLTKTGSSNPYLRVSRNYFDTNSNYIATFKVKKISGTVTGMAGHTNSFDNIATYRDGIKLPPSSWSTGDQNYPDDTNTHFYEVHFSTPASFPSDSAPYWYIQPNRPNYGPNFVIDIWDFQIEKGTKATGWNPAPEDGIESMSQAESRISQLADEIDLKVDVDGVIASINLSSEGLRIAGNKHHITGQTLIDDAVIGTSAIADAAITRLKLGTGVVGTLQIEDAAITDAKIKSVAADKISAASLDAISGNMGTLRSGRLLSNNNNMDLNLNTGTLHMQNADFSLGGGARIRFLDTANRILYTVNDPEGVQIRSAGVGIGNNINARFPYAFLGTSLGTSVFARDEDNFTGFIANTNARMNVDGIGNSVVGNIFQIRNSAIGFDKGYTFNLMGSTITMNPMTTGVYNYDIGANGARLRDVYLDRLRTGGDGALIIEDGGSGNGGYRFDTRPQNDGFNTTFRGINRFSHSYNIGNSDNRFSYIYLSNAPLVSSDERLKEDIQDNVLGLDFINDLKTHQYRLKPTGAEVGKQNVQLGLIAQQLIEALNRHNVNADDYGLVTSGGEERMYSMQYEQLIAPTIKAVQDLDIKLENEITWLKTENQFLKNEIKKLKEKVA